MALSRLYAGSPHLALIFEKKVCPRLSLPRQRPFQSHTSPMSTLSSQSIGRYIPDHIAAR